MHAKFDFLIQGDEHFVVWMRTAALRNFRKLWGRINTDIPAGANVTVLIQNRCAVASLPLRYCCMLLVPQLAS